MAAEKFQITKRKAVAVVAAAAVFAVVSASAATLGGITTDAFGADQGAVESPVQGGITLSWNTGYNAEVGEYVLEGFELDTFDPSEEIPGDAEVMVAITGESGLIQEFEVSRTSGTWTQTLSDASISVAEIQGVAVAINDRTVNTTVATDN